jgi:hypothetical protein
MTLRPKTPSDLLLAPVAAEIDQNLQPLRDAAVADIANAVATRLNAGPSVSPDGRAAQLLDFATRGVELHGWRVTMSDDASRIQLRGGSVSLDVALSRNLQRFIDG